MGHVKTRLTKTLEASIVSELYQHFVTDLVATLNGTGLPFFIYYSPTEKRSQFLSWLGTDHQYLPQKGKNLGARLIHGFHSAFKRGFTSVLAVASDIPDLSSQLLCYAAQALKHADMVIGPCFDGGYYLIGFTKQRFHPLFFTDIPWSTSTVFTKTLSIVEKTNLTVRVLPVKRDIDTLPDLQAFASRIHDSAIQSSNTGRFIRQHPDLLTQNSET